MFKRNGAKRMWQDRRRAGNSVLSFFFRKSSTTIRPRQLTTAGSLTLGFPIYCFPGFVTANLMAWPGEYYPVFADPAELKESGSGVAGVL
jgi:hypothetical protein